MIHFNRINKKHIIIALSGALTGALQACIYIPYLIFLSPVPFLFYIHRSRTRKDIRLCTLCFLLPYYFVQSAFLITVAKITPMPLVLAILLAILAVIAVTIWLTAIMLLPLWFFPALRTGKGFDLFTFSLLFIVGEWLAEVVPILSFPWSGLWLGVIYQPTLSAAASLLGCHFVSLLILISASLITLIFCHLRSRKAIGYALMLTALISSDCAYGITHISAIKDDMQDREPVKIMVAQDNVEGRDKSKLLSSDAVSSYISIIEDNWQDGIKLILLPETAVPCDYDERSDTFRPLTELAKSHDTTLLTGCFLACDGKTYNAMYSVTGEGFCKSPYLKQVLVPFGEQIPLASLWGKSTVSCAKPTSNKQLLRAGGTDIASIICIESIYPSLVRRQMQKGGELLCISTNDSWFGKSYAKHAHYRHTIMRAIESGRYTLRSGNCGISAVITPWGEQTSCIPDAQKAAIVAYVKAVKSKTLYTYVGDVIVLPGCIMILTLLIRRFRESRNTAR